MAVSPAGEFVSVNQLQISGSGMYDAAVAGPRALLGESAERTPPWG